MTRRDLLWLASAGLVSASAPDGAVPQNLSYPLRMIEGSVTSPDLLFVRDHFREPEVSLDNWRLRIEGQIEKPYELNFADLVELPSKKLDAVLECAGNAANGSAVSNGSWEGVPISSLLEAARPSANAAFVLLEGADSGSLMENGIVLPYTQLVPIAKCREESSLVAFKYNDLTLPKRNGFPARALFPGWYGMDCVKWLRRMLVVSADEVQTAFQRSGMDRLYNRVVGEKTLRLSQIQVKSAVAWPGDGVKLPAGHYTVWGFAWSGAGAIRTLSVSLDGGRNWEPARLELQQEQHGWVRWHYGWEAKPGDYSLLSRAADAVGNQQPVTRDPARQDGYELNWCLPIRCSVR